MTPRYILIFLIAPFGNKSFSKFRTGQQEKNVRIPTDNYPNKNTNVMVQYLFECDFEKKNVKDLQTYR